MQRNNRTKEIILVLAVLILCASPSLAVSVNGGVCKETPYKMGTEDSDQFALTCIGPSEKQLTGCIAEFKDENGYVLASKHVNPGDDVNAPNGAQSWSLYNCFAQEESQSALNLTWPMAMVIIMFIAFLFGVLWLYFKYSPKDEEKKTMPNPLVSAVVFGLFAIVFFLGLEALDVLPPGWSKEHWYIFVFIFVIAMMVAFWRRSPFKLMAEDKLESKVWAHIYRRLKARPHVGDGFGSPLPYNKLVQTKNNQNDSYSSAFAKKMTYIARINLKGGMHVMLSLDPTSGYLVEFIENVNLTLVRRMLGKEAAEHYDLEKAILQEQVSPRNEEVRSNQTDPATA